MLLLSIMQADTGGFVGHSAMHPATHLLMTHHQGVDATPIHELAWDSFQRTTAKAKELLEFEPHRLPVVTP